MQELIAIAGKTESVRSGIEALGKEVRDSEYEIDDVISAAEARADGKALAALLLAKAMDGPVDSEAVQRALPLLPDIQAIPLLITHSAGDRIEMIIRLVESGRLSDERSALALFIAVKLLDGKEAPPELLTQLRLIARSELGVASGSLLGAAARILDNPDVNDVAKRWVGLAETIDTSAALEAHLDELERKPLLEALPETARREPVHGYTVRRPAKKIGRNEPCHCGSGKKYKKCCAEKDKERLTDPSPVPGVTMTEYKAEAHKYMTDDKIGDLRPQELAALDFEDFSGPQLIAALRVFCIYSYWENAEELMRLLEGRKDLPFGCLADEYRYELIRYAADATANEVVLRQFDRISDPEMKEELRLKIEIMRPRADTLPRIEEEARRGLASPEEPTLTELAHSLLDSFPAVGLLMARASLNPDRLLDSELLIEEIERARDVLQLPPGDPVADYFDYLLDREVDQRIENAVVKAKDRAHADLVETTEKLRENLAETARRTETLERELAEQRQLLEKERQANAREERKPERESDQPPELSVSSNEERTTEIYRLKSKISKLKGLVSDVQKERGELRKQLSDMAGRLDSAPSPAPISADQRDDRDPETEEASLPYRERPLVPEFSDSFKGTIRKTPSNIVAGAIRLAGAICTGATTKAAKVARLKSVEDLWSARIGIHYRLLFRFSTERETLDVVDLVHREDLETAIKKQL